MDTDIMVDHTLHAKDSVLDAASRYWRVRQALIGDEAQIEITPISYFGTLLRAYLREHDWASDDDASATREILSVIDVTIQELYAILEA